MNAVRFTELAVWINTSLGEPATWLMSTVASHAGLKASPVIWRKEASLREPKEVRQALPNPCMKTVLLGGYTTAKLQAVQL